MKVLYVISYPYEATGSQRSLFATIKHLPKNIEPHILLSDKGYVQQMFEAIHIPTSVIRPSGPLQAYGKAAFSWSFLQKILIFLFHYLPYQWRVFRFLRKEKFDIIHCNSQRSMTLVMLAAKWSRVKIITHLRNEIRYQNIFKTIHEKYSDKLITVSNAIQKDISEVHFHKAVTIYDPPSSYQIPSTSSKVAKANLELICMSLIVPHKGIHHLVHAIKELNEQGYKEQIHLNCLGAFRPEHKEYEEWLKETLENHELDNIHFLGYQEDPVPYLQQADVLILPSISEEKVTYGGKERYIMGNEGLPRVLLEAAAFSKVTIASDVPGVQEIIKNEETGFIVEPGNVLELASHIKGLLDNPTQVEKMGAKAQVHYARTFSQKKETEAMVALYKELLKT